MVGNNILLKGTIFSNNRLMPPTEFNVLDIRQGRGTVINIEQFLSNGTSDYEYPTIQLLLKNKDMKRSQWSKPIPVREVNLRA